MSKICVTGCLGFIGFHVSKRLLEDGHEVIGVDNFISEEINGEAGYTQQNRQDLLNYPKFSFIPISCEELLETAKLFPETFNNTDAIIHQAAIPRVQLSFDHLSLSGNSIDSLHGVIEFMLHTKIKRIVFASSSTAKTLLSPYGLQKRYAEQLLYLFKETNGIEPTILRYHSVYGDRMEENGKYALLVPKLIKCARNNEPFTLYGDGSVERDFTYIDDVVDCTVKALRPEAIGVMMDIGHSNPVKVKQVIEIIENITDTKIRVDYKPARYEPNKTLADDSVCNRVLGRTCDTPITIGLRRMKI